MRVLYAKTQNSLNKLLAGINFKLIFILYNYMNYNQIAILFLQAALVSFIILLLFRLRKRLSIGVLYACLGLFQFIQVFLSSTVFISVSRNITVSTGSSIFFLATLFTLLIIYIKEDASETKKIIYTLFIVNIVTAILLQTFGANLREDSTNIFFSLSLNFYETNSWLLFVGTIGLFLDALLIITIFEYISRKIRFLFLQIWITMSIVICFDSFFYSIIGFWTSDNLSSIIMSGLISKEIFGIFFSIIFYLYLKYIDAAEIELGTFKVKDVFKPLSYKQKFESVKQEIKTTEEMYRILTDHTNDLICLQKPDSTFKYLSPSIKSILGYEQSDFIGKKIFEILYKDDVAPLKKAMEQKVFSKGVITDAFPIRVRHKKGHFVWLEFLTSPVYKDQEISYFVTSARDITQRILAKKKLETTLDELEKKDEALHESSRIAKIGYWEYIIATDTFIWSDYVYQVYGLDPKDKIPSRKEIIKLYDTASQEKLEQATLKLTSKHIPYDIELKLTSLRNEEVWVRYVVQLVYNQENKIIGRRGVLHNITEAKKAQLDLEFSKQTVLTSLDLLEKKDQSLSQSSKMAKIGYWEYTNATDTYVWSDYVYQIYGLDPKDGIPSQDETAKILDTPSLEKVQQAIINIDTKGISCDIELKCINIENEEIWVRYVANPLYNKQNEIIGRKGILQNITAWKKIQFELETSKQKIQISLELLEKNEYSLKSASKMAKIGYWEYNIPSDEIVWSEYVCNAFGLDPKKGVPPRKEILALYDKDSQNKIAEANLELTSKGIPYDIELKLINLKKEEVWVRNVVQPIYNEQNKIIGRRGVLQNITEAKKAQLQLVLSNQKIQTSLELLERRKYSMDEASKIAKIGYWEHDLLTGSAIWSDYIHYIFGSNPEEDVPEQEIVMSAFNNESLQKLEKATLNLTLKGVPYDLELKIINLNKEEVWVRNVAQPIYNQQKEIVGKRGIMQNITEDKKAQLLLELSKQEIETSLELLKRSEYSKNEASKMAKIGYQEYDPITNTYLWSDYIYNVLELNPKNGVPPLHDILPIFDKETQEKIKKAAYEMDYKGLPCDFEMRFINLKKEEVWLRYVAQPVFNDEDKVIGKKGLLHNITDAKKAQFELELSKQKIQTSLELLEKSEYSKNEASKMAKIGYLQDDIATDTFIWSEYLYHIFGFDPKLPVPSRKEIAVLFDEESQKKMEEATKNLDFKGIAFDLELKMINLRKEEVWTRIIVQPVYNQQNEIVGRRGLLQNITASKKAQIELKLSRQKIQTSLNLLEKKDHSLHEVSRMAKIGYWEFDNTTIVWSEYLYHIFGLDVKDKVPTKSEVIALFDKESQKKLNNANLELTSKGISYDLDVRLINLKNEEIWVRNVVQPVYNEQNEIIGRRGLLQNITAAKKAQIELELSKQKIQISLDLIEKSQHSLNEASKIAKIGYWEYNNATDTFTWSDYMYQVYGLDPKKGTQQENKIQSFYDEESRKKIQKAIKDITLKGIPCDLELKLTNLRNEEVWERTVAQPIYNERNEIVGRRGVLQNITDAKKAHFDLELSKQKILTSLELLEKSEQSKNEASKMAKIGYWEYNFETDIVLWSDYIYELYALDPKKEAPKHSEISNYFDKETQQKLEKANLDLKTKGIPYDLELRIINEKNEEIWFRNGVQPIYNQQNEIIGRRGVTQNITAFKNGQIELELSKQKILTSLELLENRKNSMDEASKVAKMGYHEYDMATETFVWSEHLYYIFGLDPKDEVLNRQEVISFFDKESKEKIIKATHNLDTNGTPYDLELKIINKKKKEIWVRNVTLPVYNVHNKIIGRRGVTQDITEQKIIEQKNLIITSRYRELFENATISIWNGDLSLLMHKLAKLRTLDIPNFKIYIEQHPDILFSLIKKVKINKVNKATIKLFKATSSKEFLKNKIQDTFGNGAFKVFEAFIISIWNREKTFISEVNYKTLKGDEFAAIISIPIPQTEIEQKTVPISIQSIQSIKDAESEKRESITKLKEAQKLAKVGSWIFSPLTQESEWSEETFHIWGLDPKLDNPKFETILKQIHPDDLELHNTSVDKAIRLGISFDIEFRIFHTNGLQKTLRGICQPVLSDIGEVISLKGTNQDITEQKLVRNKIEEAEEMYRILTDNSNDLICLHEIDSSFKYISPSIKSLLGYEQADLLGKKVFSIIHKEDIKPLKEVMKQRMFSSMHIDAFTCRVLHKSGHYIWLEFLSSPVYKNKKVSYFVSSARDITQWILAKQEIQEYQTSLQKLTTEITIIEEKQKKEIATNIHDHLSQSLVISKMKINELKKNPHLKVVDEDLKFIETHISEALENSRKITYELSPPVLYQLGIIDALSWLLDNIEATHKIECVINSNVNSINLSELKSILLYRSIQEVINNAIKYAKATLITLDLDQNKLGLDIFITDNGLGFDTSNLNNLHNHSGSGFGLFTVKERIKNIQGKFTIKSKLNVGTTVKIFIPLSK